MAPGELWKAQQLKEYRRAQGLCFNCGDKYAPDHVSVKQEAQLKAIAVQEEPGILFDDILDDVTAPELVVEDFNLSLDTLAGTCSSATVQLRALVGNQVIISGG